jgi:hypothetical protein
MYIILDCADPLDQFFEGHRCHATHYEMMYGFTDHPNCQDTFAETIREYGLTPDDVHTSYNFWMYATLDSHGRRQFHWNRARKGDYVELVALFDTLSVPVICGGDLGNVNNLDYAPMQISIFEASQETSNLVNRIQERFGRYKTQITPSDFKVKDIRSQRKLERDPNYMPGFIPAPKKIAIEVNVSPATLSILQPLTNTGVYGSSEAKIILACFMRWYNQSRARDRFTKLSIRS